MNIKLNAMFLPGGVVANGSDWDYTIYLNPAINPTAARADEIVVGATVITDQGGGDYRKWEVVGIVSTTLGAAPPYDEAVLTIRYADDGVEPTPGNANGMVLNPIEPTSKVAYVWNAQASGAGEGLVDYARNANDRTLGLTAGTAGADGQDGADGNTVLYGTSDPTTEGVDGNFYINTTTHTIFGPKSGTWPAGTSIIGPQGPQGGQGDPGQDGADGTSVVLKGSVALVGDLTALEGGAVVGDLYVVTGDGNGYVWNGATWDNAGPIQGPAGADGADGITPTKGVDYFDGADGLDGDSAYEIAVTAGFVGTQQEWLDSLVGADGADGTAISDADVKTKYESNADTNAFTDNEQTKLANIADNANLYVHPATHTTGEISGFDTAVSANADVTAAKGHADTAHDYEPTIAVKGTAFNKSFGTGVGDVCQGNDARLSDARVASDVYAWAKEATKPTYTNVEVGAAATDHGDHGLATHAATQHGTTVTEQTNITTAVNHAGAAHAPSDATSAGAAGDAHAITAHDYAPSSHNHNDVYYTETEVDTLLAGVTPAELDFVITSALNKDVQSNEGVIYADATSTGVNITLPDPTDADAKSVYIMRKDNVTANIVRITAYNATVNGESWIDLEMQREGYKFIPNATDGDYLMF